MWQRFAWLAVALVLACEAIGQSPAATATRDTNRAKQFPRELVEWMPRAGNPVFRGAGAGNWDAAIRERGWIMREGGVYRLWYTGYDGTRDGIKQLGYATSADGCRWTRSKLNPLVAGRWIEDVMVVRDGETYFMFAEGPRQSESQLLTSTDGVQWKPWGVLEIRTTSGKRIEPPVGTPTVIVEEGVWWLFYERGDLGVWLAASRDPSTLIWRNVNEEPVLSLGPNKYDSEQIALDQIFFYQNQFYALYHGSGGRDAAGKRIWNTNIARSTDLRHWKKFPGNPIVADNKSSGIVVPTGNGHRLYTMHDRVDVFESPHE